MVWLCIRNQQCAAVVHLRRNHLFCSSRRIEKKCIKGHARSDRKKQRGGSYVTRKVITSLPTILLPCSLILSHLPTKHLRVGSTPHVASALNMAEPRVRHWYHARNSVIPNRPLPANTRWLMKANNQAGQKIYFEWRFVYWLNDGTTSSCSPSGRESTNLELKSGSGGSQDNIMAQTLVEKNVGGGVKGERVGLWSSSNLLLSPSPNAPISLDNISETEAI